MSYWPLALIERELRQAAAQAGADWSVELMPEVDSSNSELMRRARAGRTDARLLIAQSQSAGRGRLGRDWTSSAGDSLTFSIGIALAPQDWSGLSLAIGVALADALDPDHERGVALKWPNDLWLAERKLAGVLIETVAASGLAPNQRYAVIGVGINLSKPAATGLSTPPAWLREIDQDADAARLLQQVAALLASALKEFEAMGFAPFHARFDQRDALRDRPVTAAGGSGDPLVGTACGVGDSGELLVRTTAGMRAVAGSEVTVRPAAVESC